MQSRNAPVQSVVTFLLLCGITLAAYEARNFNGLSLFRTSQLPERSAVRRLSQAKVADQITLHSNARDTYPHDGALDLVLAHNLTAEGEVALHLTYQRRLQQILGSTGQLIKWEASNARQRSCEACKQLNPGSQVSVVGNGPVSEQQREQIAASGCIVRFNRLNNLDRASKERTDVWFIRGAGVRWHAPWVGYEGEIDPGVIVLANEFWRELSPNQQSELARGAGGADADSDADYPGYDYNDSQEGEQDDDEDQIEQEEEGGEAGNTKGRVGREKGVEDSGDGGSEEWPHWQPSRRYSRVPWTAFAAAFAAERSAAPGDAWRRGRLLPLELTPLNNEWRAFTRELGYTQRTLPSTGLIGILSMLDCLPPGTTMHVYGFNWSPHHWEGHNMEVEGSLLRLLSSWRGQVQEVPRLVLHPTPCQDCLRGNTL